MDIVNKFRIGLKKTSTFISSNIIHSLKSKKINPKIIDDIETVLISADIGLDVTEYLIEKMKNKKITNQTDATLLLKLLETEITNILSKSEKTLIEDFNSIPTIFLFANTVLAIKALVDCERVLPEYSLIAI